MGEITRLLRRLSSGDRSATDALMEIVYGELLALARKHMRSERPGHTLTPSELVHEAFLRLVDQRQVDWKNRSHFFAVASTAMRRILISHARRVSTRRRVTGQAVVTFVTGSTQQTATVDELIALDRALDKLSSVNERRGSVVQLSFFAGLTQREIAEVLGVSVPTVKKDWQVARVWLSRELSAA